MDFFIFRGWLFTSLRKQVCYGTLGCFSTSHPFTNSKGMLPRPPDVIDTTFRLFTRSSTPDYEDLVLTDQHKKCAWKSLCEPKDIKLIIHGYMDSADKQWVKDMIKALLEHVSPFPNNLQTLRYTVGKIQILCLPLPE